jgi:hypothetical protein
VRHTVFRIGLPFGLAAVPAVVGAPASAHSTFAGAGAPVAAAHDLQIAQLLHLRSADPALSGLVGEFVMDIGATSATGPTLNEPATYVYSQYA